MNVELRATSPFFAGGNKLKFGHALCAKIDFHRTVERLAAERDDDADAFLQCSLNLGLEDDL